MQIPYNCKYHIQLINANTIYNCTVADQFILCFINYNFDVQTLYDTFQRDKFKTKEKCLKKSEAKNVFSCSATLFISSCMKSLVWTMHGQLNTDWAVNDFLFIFTFLWNRLPQFIDLQGTKYNYKKHSGQPQRYWDSLNIYEYY